MNEHIKSTAKRLLFSLLLVSALGGCATYASGPYGQSYGAAPVSLGVGFYQGGYGYQDYGPRYYGRSQGYRGARHQGFRGHPGIRSHQGRGGRAQHSRGGRGHQGGGHRR